MQRLLHSTSFKVFAVVLAALLAGSAASAVSHSGTSPIAVAVGTVFSPAQRLAAMISRGAAELPFSFKSSSVLAGEIVELQSQVADLKAQIVDYEDIKKENALYKEFYDLKTENPDQKYCEAAIIGRDAGDYLKSFTLNKGTSSEINAGDPVVLGRYLVGVVSSVTPTTCTVKTILNPDVNVSCYEIRTKTLGYSTTTVELAQEGFCEMPNLPADTAMTSGGQVCTSGVGGVYPADLIIGTIDSVIDATINISASAIIKPAVDIDSITDVFVITQFNGQGVQ